MQSKLFWLLVVPAAILLFIIAVARLITLLPR